MSWDITMLIRSINNNSIEESDKSRENRLHEHKQWPSRALYTLSPFLQPFSARHRAEMPKLEARTWHKCSVAKTVAILFTAGTIWNKREINAVTKKNTFRCRSRSLARHRPFSRSFLLDFKIGDGYLSGRYAEEHKSERRRKRWPRSRKTIMVKSTRTENLSGWLWIPVILLGGFRSVKIILRPFIGRRHCETTAAVLYC